MHRPKIWGYLVMTGSAQLHWFTDNCLRVPSQGISHIILGLVIDRQQSGSGHTHSFNSFVDSVEYYSNCKKGNNNRSPQIFCKSERNFNKSRKKVKKSLVEDWAINISRVFILISLILDNVISEFVFIEMMIELVCRLLTVITVCNSSMSKCIPLRLSFFWESNWIFSRI